MDIVTLVKHYIPSETPAVVLPLRERKKKCEQIYKWPKRNCTMHAFSYVQDRFHGHNIPTLRFLKYFIYMYLLIKNNRRLCSKCVHMMGIYDSSHKLTKHLSRKVFFFFFFLLWPNFAGLWCLNIGLDKSVHHLILS